VAAGCVGEFVDRLWVVERAADRQSLAQATVQSI
jgi:hypothetical protein